MTLRAKTKRSTTESDVVPKRVVGLRYLIGPEEPSAFTKRYWERRPLVIRRGLASYYDGLLSIADVDRILGGRLEPSQLRLVREGKDVSSKVLSSAKSNRIEIVYQHYRDGFTLVLPGLHEHWKPLSELCLGVGSDLSAECQVNAYLTPPHERGLETHYDTHDVFVIQVSGSKHWRVFDSPIRLPDRRQEYTRGAVKPGRLLEEFELEPGDCLYLPRGFLHDARTTDGSSLHLTLGVHTVTWGAVVLKTLERMIVADPRLRQSLPPGFACTEEVERIAGARLGKLLPRIWNRMDPSAVVRDAAEARVLGTRVALDGHLLDLEAESGLTLTTELRRRNGVSSRSYVRDGRLCLAFHGKVVQMPRRVAKPLGFMGTTERFTGAQLPGGLDAAGRLCLVRRLLKEGFLTRVENDVPRERAHTAASRQ